MKKLSASKVTWMTGNGILWHFTTTVFSYFGSPLGFLSLFLHSRRQFKMDCQRKVSNKKRNILIISIHYLKKDNIISDEPHVLLFDRFETQLQKQTFTTVWQKGLLPPKNRTKWCLWSYRHGIENPFDIPLTTNCKTLQR